MEYEYITLPRAWRDTVSGFRRRLDAVWFAYFEHLGLTPDYLAEGVKIEGQAFNPCLFIREWRVFAYVLPESRIVHPQVQSIIANAQELARAMPEFDVIVIFGKPDELTTHIELYSVEFKKFLNSWSCNTPLPMNRWTISGTIDRDEGVAYYWMLMSADNLGYIPGSKQWYAVCLGGGEHCDLCRRFEHFLPADVYGTAFSIDLDRHLPCEARKRVKRSRGISLCRR